MAHPDYILAGAGLLGLSLALELEARGACVLVLEQGEALRQASFAAAGMLAAHDPENPPELRALSDLALELHPGYRASLTARGGLEIPVQTAHTLQGVSPAHQHSVPLLSTEELHEALPPLHPGDRRFTALDEHSVDPRQLAASLQAAVRHSHIELREHTAVDSFHVTPEEVEVRAADETLHTATFVDTRGAWAHHGRPRKGQMLAVTMPPGLKLTTVIRTPEMYIVPRTAGPQAGRAIIGATVEDAGFDIQTHTSDLERLRAQATAMLPELADAPIVDHWAGLRPATVDSVPIFGWMEPGRHLLATGLYRNGILLAPSAARVLAQLLTGEPTSVSLEAFTPKRFA